MSTFPELGLPESILSALERMKYTAPTPIQEQSIPMALDGRDILGSAQTGTGKTGAFSIPLVAHLLEYPESTAIVLTPTRELAAQVTSIVNDLTSKQKDIRSALIIGGEPYGKQLDQLRRNPRIIVGTPGRINDHLRRGTINLSKASFLVLDETDRMLDMGFGVQLDDIVEKMPAERQTLMFSATLPKGIVKISNKYLVNPHRVSVGAVYNVADKVRQEVREVSQDQKFPTLCGEIEARHGSIIVFVKTKRTADEMAQKLRKTGVAVDALHGDLRQRVRDKVLRNFRAQKFRVLVATDVAARGLDVPHIEHVVNYDLPVCPEDYIHRIGRTARGEAEGDALALVAPHDRRHWRAIQLFLGGDDNYADELPKGGRGGKSRGKPRRSGGPGYKGGGDSSRRRTNGEFPRKKDGYRGKKREDGFEGKRSEYRDSKPRSSEGNRSEYRDSKPRSSEGNRSEYRDSKPRSSEGKRSEGSAFKGKSFGGKKPDFKGSKPKKFDDRASDHKSSKPRNETSEKSHESSGDKPFSKKPRWDKKRKDVRNKADGVKRGRPTKKRRIV